MPKILSSQHIGPILSNITNCNCLFNFNPKTYAERLFLLWLLRLKLGETLKKQPQCNQVEMGVVEFPWW